MGPVTGESPGVFCGITSAPGLFTVLPVPYDLTTSYVSGARNGPRAIIEASCHMELYDEELGIEPRRAGIATLEPVEATTAGPGRMVERVEEAAAGIVEAGSIPVLLGGEHSVSLGPVRALRARHASLSVLHLDAHADMRDTYQESPFSHACVARRISELCPVTQVGIRSLSGEEAEFLKTAEPVRTFYASGVRGGTAAADIIASLSDEVYVTVDLDVFDPSVMPSTGTPEPGGLGWYEVTGLLREVAAKRKIVGFDVVELSPIPGIVAPDFLAARLVYKLMGYTAPSA